jgi:hypothetical protein
MIEKNCIMRSYTILLWGGGIDGGMVRCGYLPHIVNLVHFVVLHCTVVRLEPAALSVVTTMVATLTTK